MNGRLMRRNLAKNLNDGLKVIMMEPTDWIGGQLTSQGVPSDENPWIETFGAFHSYQDYRTRVRNFYRHHYPLRNEVRSGQVSEPAI